MPFWESSAFWGIAGIVVGAIVATLFFLLSKARKRLEYQIDSTRLITENMANIPGISITLDGKQVKTVVSTTVKFINTGNQAILSNDFAALAPLGISVTGQFFSTSQGIELYTNAHNSSLSIGIVDGTRIHIEFEFLKPKQFILVTLLHSGDLTILGELKTGEKIKEKNLTKRIDFFTVIIFLSTGIIGMLIGAYPVLIRYVETSRMRTMLLTPVSCIITVVVVLHALVSILRKFLKRMR